MEAAVPRHSLFLPRLLSISTGGDKDERDVPSHPLLHREYQERKKASDAVVSANHSRYIYSLGDVSAGADHEQ